MKELEAKEREWAKDGTTYEWPTGTGHFYPEGVYFDADVTWVYSNRHNRQIGFRRIANGWTKAGERRGRFKTGLYLGASEAPPRAYRLVAADKHLVIASWMNPRLTAMENHSGTVVARLNLDAPVRDFIVDKKRGLLWTIGPENKPVTRRNGIIENLRTAIYAYELPGLKRQKSIVWDTKDLVDGNSLGLSETEIFAAAGGSARLWRYNPESGKSALVETGAVPRGIAFKDGKIFIAGFLADQLEIFDTETNQSTRLDLGEKAGKLSQTRIGELLFYQAGMWADTAENAYTCNSCHWDGLSDHRIHPGFHESRYELTRPIAGIGAVSPVFTPMQASSLSDAVEGLFRALDVRYWLPASAEPYYLQPVRVRIAPGEIREIAAKDARLSLIKALIEWPAMPPAARRPGEPLSEAAQVGFKIFQSDCARCHEPAYEMRQRRRGSETTLRDRPLVFGAPFYAKSGVEPYYTPNGNRISPLMNLARGGPYFSNGSAPDLDAVILRTNPRAELVHAPENAKKPYYETLWHARLAAFLRSI